MNNFKIDTRKKTLSYKLEFKYLGEVLTNKIDLIKLQNEDLIVNGETSDFIVQLVLAANGLLGIKVSTIEGKKIVNFSLPQLDIKFVSYDD